MSDRKNLVWLFCGPIAWLLALILLVVVGGVFIGAGHPSGIQIGLIYGMLLSPITGLAGLVYIAIGKIERPKLLSITAIILNIVLVSYGIIAWYEWLYPPET